MLVAYGLSQEPVNPIGQVFELECEANLGRLQLVLPDEEQWEYVARAGSETVWWTGDDVHSLQGKANLFDERSFPSWPNR